MLAQSDVSLFWRTLRGMRPLSIRLEFGQRTGLLQQVAAETLPVEQLKQSPASRSLSFSPSPMYICYFDNYL